MKRIKKSSRWSNDKFYCAGCLKRIGYLDKFCHSCGEKIEWETCPHCGHNSEPMIGDFCRDCGYAPLRKIE